MKSIQTEDLVYALGNIPFPGSLSAPGHLDTVIGYKRGFPKKIEGRAKSRSDAIKGRSPESYVRMESEMRSIGVPFLPEYVIPLNKETSKRLKTDYIRCDWYIPIGTGYSVEWDLDTYHRYSADKVRDDYLSHHFGVTTLRIKSDLDIEGVIGVLSGLDCKEFRYPVFTENNRELWGYQYHREIEFLDKYIQKYSRYPLGPDYNVGGGYKVTWGEVREIMGYRTEGPWKEGSNEWMFCERFREFYQELYKRKIIFVGNQDTTKASNP